MSRSSDTRLRSRHTHFAPRPLPRGVLVVFRAEAACFFFAAADTFNITGSAGAELPSTRICDDDSGVPAILSSVYVMYGRCNETSTHQHSVARPTSPSPTSSSHCYHQILVSLSSYDQQDCRELSYWVHRFCWPAQRLPIECLVACR